MKQFVTLEFLLGVHKKAYNADPISAESRVYYEVFSNLTDKSELVIDIEEGKVYAQLSDPRREMEPSSVILRKLVFGNSEGLSKVQFISTRKDYKKVFDNELTFPELNGSVRLITKSKQQSPENPLHIPEIDLSVERLNYYYKTYLAQSDSVLYTITPSGSFTWKDLSWIHQPVSGLLIVDRYVLSHLDSIPKNLYPLLNQLLKGAYPDTSIEITILTETVDGENDEGDIIKTIIDGTKKYLKKKLNKNDINLSILINKSDQRSIRRLTHDRVIITNYLWLECGNSFRFFDEKGRLGESVDTTLKVHSNLNAKGFKPIKSRIQQITKNILPLAEPEGEIVRSYGDFSKNPIFELE